MTRENFLAAGVHPVGGFLFAGPAGQCRGPRRHGLRTFSSLAVVKSLTRAS